MQLKYGWEHSADATRLGDLWRNGMFTNLVFVSAAFYDDSGVSVMSPGLRAMPPSIPDDGAFTFHKSNNSTAPESRRLT